MEEKIECWIHKIDVNCGSLQFRMIRLQSIWTLHTHTLQSTRNNQKRTILEIDKLEMCFRCRKTTEEREGTKNGDRYKQTTGPCILTLMFVIRISNCCYVVVVDTIFIILFCSSVVHLVSLFLSLFFCLDLAHISFELVYDNFFVTSQKIYIDFHVCFVCRVDVIKCYCLRRKIDETKKENYKPTIWNKIEQWENKWRKQIKAWQGIVFTYLKCNWRKRDEKKNKTHFEGTAWQLDEQQLW